MSSGDQSAAIEAAVGGAAVRRDMVLVLPTELVRRCFRLLDFRERIFVSHVSRAWRAVALNDCFLWTEAPSPYTRCHSGSEMLRILLARSDPLPFSFSWDYPLPRVCLPKDTADVVCANMHQMESLYIKELAHDDVERLFRLPAPLLKTFGDDDAKGSPVHPALWPRLEDMRIVSLALRAAPQPFAAVHTFYCWDIIHFAVFGTSLFSVFPALKVLRARNITEGDLAFFFSGPPSMMDEVSLGAADAWFGIDYAPLLRSFHALRVNRLRLQMAREAAGLVELFSASAKGPWRMEIDEHTAGTRAKLYEDGQEREWIVVCETRISFYREPRIAACLLRLESLTGSITLLVELHNLDGRSRALPALRALTLQLLRTASSDTIPVPRDTPRMHMPLLTSVTLWLDGMTVEIQQRLETHLPALLPAILEQVPSVIIDVVDLIDVRAFELAPLAAVANGVLVQERPKG